MSAERVSPDRAEHWFSFAEREQRFHLLLESNGPTRSARLACGYRPSRSAYARRRELVAPRRGVSLLRCLSCLEVRAAHIVASVPTRARGAAEPISHTELTRAIEIVVAERWLLERLKPLLVAGGRPPEWISTFLNGGCLIFAEALRRVIGGELVALIEFDDEDDRFDDETAASHVLVKLNTPAGPRFFDARGPLGDERKLFSQISLFGLSDYAQLIPFDLTDAKDHEIGYNEELTHDLAIALRAALRGQRSLTQTRS